MNIDEERIVITDRIKSVCKRQMPFPIVIIIIMVILLFVLPFYSVMNPKKVDGIFNVKPTDTFVEMTADNLKYSGYDVKDGFGSKYSYYYTMKDNICAFALIPTGENPASEISKITFKGKVIPQNKTFKDMISKMSRDLSWTEEGLSSISVNYIVSSADYHPYRYFAIFWFILVIIGIALMRLIIAILGYRNPYFYPVCSFLSRKENRDMINQAQAELDSENYLQINNTYITENFYIGLDKLQVSVMPLSDIIWVYRLGRRGFDFKKQTLTYTIRFVIKNGSMIKIKHKSSDEALGIMNAIRATEYDIIIGHSDLKRKEAREKLRTEQMK